MHSNSSTTEVALERSLRQGRGIYRHACPNCGGSISDYRLLLKAPCEECIPDEELKMYEEIISKADNRVRRLKIYYSITKREGRLRKLIEEEEELVKFEKFFEKATKGYRMWSAQRAWARRLIRGESFSIIAPTGMGKTVFSLIASLYRVQEARKSSRKIYLAFPTTPLLIQSWNKLLKFAENAGLKICDLSNAGKLEQNDCIKVICIHGKLGKKEKELYMELVRSGNFDILLTTSAFLHKHADSLPKGVYDLVVMDDVDAVLRSGKAIKRLLNLIGIDDSAIEKGLQVIKYRAKLASLQGSEADKVRQELDQLTSEISKVKQSIRTILIVNSATGRPRGIYPKLFKVFLNFEAGSKPEAIRNIVDAYVEPGEKNLVDVAVELCRKLRDGILVFVPVDKGVEFAEYVAEKLREAGLAAEAFHAKKSAKLVDEFASGKLNVLVGVATYYGTMVRGLDLPERVKYVVFVGIPRHKFSSKLENVSPTDILRMLVVIRDVVEGEEKERVELLIGRIARRLRALSAGALMKIRELFAQAVTSGLKGDESPLIVDLYDAYSLLKSKLADPGVWDKLKNVGDVAIVSENGELYVMVPDVATYIQASGRCSRLYPGGITKGLSVIIVDDPRLLNGIVRRMKWIFEEFKIAKLSDIDLDSLMQEISKEREEVARIMRGEVKPEKQLELVRSALLIVESPNKAKTIANFFGKPSVRVLGEGLQAYEVSVGNYLLTIIATGGHVYDLVVDSRPSEAEKYGHLYGVITLQANSSRMFLPIYTDIKTCHERHQFTDDTGICPKCKSPLASRKLNIIEVLRKLASEVDVVLIGTDPDSEGEKIAWDLRVLLEPYANSIQRIEFHEVTRRAILEALKNPREFDTKLVEAQIVRRVEDRWIGFSLSEIVQQYAWLGYCVSYLYGRNKVEDIGICCKPNRNLSAGRVQTPVLGFIVEERYKKARPEYARYSISIVVEKQQEPLIVTLSYNEAREAGIVDEQGKVINYPENVVVEVISEFDEPVNPPPPYTTDMLLEDASRIYGFSTTKTMNIAQELFESGLITYHRTDSTRVSDVGIDVARRYLEDRYGDKYHEVFKPRSWGVGGAHEAIRPTRPVDADRLLELLHEGAIVVTGRITKDHIRLYDLIFRRFIASQMKPALIKKQKIKLKIGSFERELDVVVGILDAGYLEVYRNIKEQAKYFGPPGIVLSGFVQDVKKMSYPLPRYHDVIRWMKENGIGRPSTYAKIVQTIVDRRYVEVSKKLKALIATQRGIGVYEFLNKYFKDVVSVETTRRLEETMDKIEKGEVEYQKVLNQLYEEVQNRILSKTIIEKIEEDLSKELRMCKLNE